jgi:hypothetical protein
MPQSPRDDVGHAITSLRVVYTEIVVDRLRSFRVSDGVWLQAVEIAKQRGESLSEVLRDALRRYIRRNS